MSEQFAPRIGGCPTISASCTDAPNDLVVCDRCSGSITLYGSFTADDIGQNMAQQVLDRRRSVEMNQYPATLVETDTFICTVAEGKRFLKKHRRRQPITIGLRRYVHATIFDLLLLIVLLVLASLPIRRTIYFGGIALALIIACFCYDIFEFRK